MYSAFLCVLRGIKGVLGLAPWLRKLLSSPLPFTPTEYIHLLPHASVVAQLSSTELSALKQNSSYLRPTTVDKRSIFAPCSSFWSDGRSGFLAASDLLLTVRIKNSAAALPLALPPYAISNCYAAPTFFLKKFIHSSSCRLWS